MSDYNKNEDGEYLMTAAELRFEAELDMQAAEERFYDDFMYGDYEPDDDECDVDYDLDLHDGHAWCYTHDERAENCDSARGLPDFGAEDAHLDGMYED